MGEVLSQNEIDDLLAALNSGVLDVDEIKRNTKEDNKKQIKDYNFARPSKFAKEQLRTLEIIFENYTRLISTNFPVYFRTSTQTEIISAEAVTYSEFTNSLPNPAILGIVDFSPLKGSVLLELSNKIGYAIIDRLLGGKGTPLDRKKEFSEIEIAILERILEKCVHLLVEPWENVVQLTPELEKIESNPQYAQIVSSNEIVALITINIKVGDIEGLMNVCIPYIVIESIMDKLNTKFWFSTMQKNKDEDFENYIERNIEKTGISVRTILGKSNITVNEFVNLQPGDIIKLDKKTGDDLDILVDHYLKYRGKPGTLKNKNAISIVSVYREGEE